MLEYGVYHIIHIRYITVRIWLNEYVFANSLCVCVFSI